MKALSVIFTISLIIAFALGFTSASLANFFITATTRIVDETKTYTTYLIVRKTVTDTVTFTITRTIHEIDKDSKVSCAIFKTNKDVYKMSENIILILINNCNYSLILPNSAPWITVDVDGRIVNSPIALQVITYVEPGEERRWIWNQRDNEGAQVLAGRYYAKLTTINAGTFTTEFEIIES